MSGDADYTCNDEAWHNLWAKWRGHPDTVGALEVARVVEYGQVVGKRETRTGS